jgi:hypothetical protein
MTTLPTWVLLVWSLLTIALLMFTAMLWLSASEQVHDLVTMRAKVNDYSRDYALENSLRRTYQEQARLLSNEMVVYRQAHPVTVKAAAESGNIPPTPPSPSEKSRARFLHVGEDT